MNGLIALLGSGEYLPVMNEVDAYLLANCGANGRKPRVVCLPTAAGKEGDASVGRWMKMGVDHFTKLGAKVQALKVTDKETANDVNHAEAVKEADFVYFSGGDPMYLYQTMKDSLVWQAVENVLERGGVYAGCSAGAMILGREVPDFRMLGSRSNPVFGLVPAEFIIPHFDAIPIFFKPLVTTARKRLHNDEVLVGIDENTAIIGRANEAWTVMGSAKAHVFTKNDSKSHAAGEKFTLGK
ncbi:MAG: hypothetical protein Fur0017_29940 [Anaerolineales bacterium]